MAPSKHDPFKNPTVAEAVCEIHFGVSDQTFWQGDWIDTLKARVGTKFSGFEKREIREIRAEFGPQGVKIADKTPAVPRAVFRNENSTLLLQVSPGLVAVNEVSTYRGWAQFLADIRDAWEIVSQVSHPDGIKRIGLRYINRLPRLNPHEPVGDWLASCAFIPERLRTAKSRFMNRMEDGTQPDQRLVVTVAESAEGDLRPIVFDIDSTSEAAVEPGWDTINGVIERLHDESWNVFSSAIGTKLKRVLDGDVS